MAYNGKKLSAAGLRHWIGSMQRATFVAGRGIDYAVTVDDIRGVHDLSRGTVNKLIREIRRLWGEDSLLERNVPLETGDGRKRAGRPEKAYWLPNGHLWEAVNKPLARMVVAAGGAGMAMDGWHGVMDADGVRAAATSERRAISAATSKAHVAHCAKLWERGEEGRQRFMAAVDAPRWVVIRSGGYG